MQEETIGSDPIRAMVAGSGASDLRESAENGTTLLNSKATDLATLEQTKSQLIAELVHDLRTPLVSIRGYTKMILEGRVGPITETQHEYLGIAAENTTRVIELLKKLTQLTSSQPLHFEVFDATEVWNNTFDLLRSRAIGKSVKISECMPEEPLVLFGDKQKLTDVFANLLFNTVECAAVGGEVTVEFAGRDEGEVTITIRDQNATVPAAEFQKVTSPGDGPPDNSPPDMPDALKGSLSAVQEIIRLHGGQISVFTKTGGGIAFSITLPNL